jgi:hypothetical protein
MTSLEKISSDYIIQLNQFCDTDKDIEICQSQLDKEIFKVDWFIGLFVQGIEKEIDRPELLNAQFFKDIVKNFYIRARDYLKRYRFFGYFCVKDIHGWYDYVLNKQPKGRKSWNSTTNKEEEESSVSSSSEDDEVEPQEEEEEDDIDLIDEIKDKILKNLPFGVIDLSDDEVGSYGNFYRLSEKLSMYKTIIFQCTDKERAEKYDFFVVNQGAKFINADAPLMLGGSGNGGKRTGLAAFAGSDLIPVSPFVDIYDQKKKLLEAELSLFDANSMIVYQEGYMTAKPMADGKIEEMTEDELYGFEQVLGTFRQTANTNKEDISLENTRFQRQRIQMDKTIQNSQIDSGSGKSRAERKKKSSIFMQRKADFDRPSLVDGLDYLPKSVEMPRISPGVPIIPIEERIRRYENDICSIMKLPYTFFKPHASRQSPNDGAMDKNKNKTNSGIASGGGSLQQNEQYQKLLESEVKEQQTLFDSIFKDIYAHTFYKLDAKYHPRVSAELKNKKTGSLFQKRIESGIRFNNIVVKSDAAVMNLLPYYHAGIIDAVIIRELLYKNYDIQLDPRIEPAHKEQENDKKRKYSEEKEEPSKKQKKEEEEDNEAEDSEEKNNKASKKKEKD